MGILVDPVNIIPYTKVRKPLEDIAKIRGVVWLSSRNYSLTDMMKIESGKTCEQQAN